MALIGAGTVVLDGQIRRPGWLRTSHRRIVDCGPGAPPAFPAALDGVIAVTAVDVDGRLFEPANRGDYVDVAAPGVRVIAPAAGPETGTSFAAPFVTAWVAAKIAEGGPADAAAMHRAIAATARDLGPAGRDPDFGWGLLQSDGNCGRR